MTTFGLVSTSSYGTPAEAGPNAPSPPLSPLVHEVRKRFDAMQRHRTTTRVDQRLDMAVRAYDGRYEPERLAMIRQTRGSEVYVKLIAAKCRGAAALLRDVYLGSEQPWQVKPTPWPTLPESIDQMIQSLVSAEMQMAGPAGAPLLPQRLREVRIAALRASQEKAKRDALLASRKLDDLLTEGRFYEALGNFLVDLPIYPYAVMTGPSVEPKLDVMWGPDGKAIESMRPVLTWRRVSPYDFWWSPGVERATDGDTAERVMVPAWQLASMREVAGWNRVVIDWLLQQTQYGPMKKSWFFVSDQNRKFRENRDWDEDRSIFDLMRFHGWLQGSCLIQQRLTAEEVGISRIDPGAMYLCEVWLAGDMALKTRVVPWPSPMPPYYITSYEKVPGSVAGHGLRDILSDVADVINGCARALCNNMAIASGPQIGVNVDALPPGEDFTQIFPWRVWPMSMQGQPGTVPISFFQPQSNAAELLGVYKEFMNMADEISGIPRYQMGSERTGGGAGRTASGLAMLMTNASKGQQQVAMNVDTDVIEPILSRLYDVVMLTDTTGMFRGDEELVARGASTAQKIETERQRQLEFLQATNNPVDLQITGMEGRGTVLRSVAETIGLDSDRVVPGEEALRAQASANTGVPGTPQAVGQGPGPIPGDVAAGAAQGSTGTPPGAPGGPPGPAPTGRPGPMVNAVQPGGR